MNAQVRKIMAEDPNLPALKSSLVYRLVKEIGMKYEKHQRRSVLIDDNRIARWRKEYILDMERFRKEGRPIYYLDETWVNAFNHFVKGIPGQNYCFKPRCFSKWPNHGSATAQQQRYKAYYFTYWLQRGICAQFIVVFKSKKMPSIIMMKWMAIISKNGLSQRYRNLNQVST